MNLSHIKLRWTTVALFAVPVLVVVALVALAASGSSNNSAEKTPTPAAQNSPTTTTAVVPGGGTPDDQTTPAPPPTTTPGDLTNLSPTPPATGGTSPVTPTPNGPNYQPPPAAPIPNAPPATQFVSFKICPAVSPTQAAAITGGGPYQLNDFGPGQCAYQASVAPMLVAVASSGSFATDKAAAGAVALGNGYTKTPRSSLAPDGAPIPGFNLYKSGGGFSAQVQWPAPEGPNSVVAATEMLDRLLSYAQNR